MSRSATVEVRTETLSVGKSVQRRNVPVTLRDASIGGVSMEAIAEALDRGATVTIKVQVGVRTLSLPAQIVWSKRDGATSVAGVRIHLAVTDATTRKSWEGFVGTAKMPAQAEEKKPAQPTPSMVIRINDLFEK